MILRAVSGLIAGGAGVGSGDIPRVTARATPSTSPSPVVGTSVTALGRLCGWARCPRRAGRPGRVGHSPPPSALAPRAAGAGGAARTKPVLGFGARRTHYLTAFSSGWRRALPTSHWPWAVCRAARRRAGSPARIATFVSTGVQWGGSGLARLRVDRRQRRSVGGSGAVALGPACALFAGPSPWWRIASGARLRRSRGHRAGRGQSAGPNSPAGVLLVSGGQSLSGLRPLGSN
jgi:hypothetical protein